MSLVARIRSTLRLAAPIALASCAPAPELARGLAGDANGGLVFVRVDASGSGDLARARLRDGAVAWIARTPDRDERWPVWSEHAARLACQVRQRAQHFDLALLDPATGRETLIDATPERDEGWPEWSPAASVLAYAFVGGTPPSGLALYRAATAEVSLAAEGGVADFFLRPQFSPDGARLVAQRRPPSGNGSALWIVSPGEPPRPLTRDPAWFDLKAWFTRDGRSVVFSRAPAAGGPRDVAIVAAEGGAVRLLAAHAADDHSARPSPVRDEVVFVSDRDGSPGGLFLLDLSGGEPRRLTRDAGHAEHAPRWSPDGERIAFTRSAPAPAGEREEGVDPRTTEIVVIDRDGREQLRTPGAMPDWMPAW
jgi:hypothetical protein